MNQADEILRLQKLLAEQQNLLDEQQKEIERLRIQNENLTQAVLHAQKKKFGASSESSKQIEGQLSLFSENHLVENLAKEQENLIVKTHKRKPRQAGIRKEMLANLPTEIIRLVVEDDQECPVCQSEIIKIASTVVRSEVVYQPAVLKVIQYVQDVYKCIECGKARSENKVPTIIKANTPKPVLPHSIVSPSVIARSLYQKYDMGIPLNRMVKDWYSLGFVVNKQTLINWVNRCCEEWLRPVYDRIHQQLIKCEVLHCDETKQQCNKEPGKPLPQGHSCG